MGLLVGWILFFPFYGPGLLPANIDSTTLGHIFTLSHVTGLLGGNLLYSKSVRVRSFLFLIRGSPFFLAILTAFYPIIIPGLHQPYVLLYFITLGLLSGLMAFRWMSWFSSPEIVQARGDIMAKAIGICYVLIFVKTMLINLPFNGLIYSYLIGALSVLAGTMLINQLPYYSRDYSRLKIKSILPPYDLVLFAILAYGSVALIHRFVLQIPLNNSSLSWLVLIPYLLIALFLGRWSDRNGRNLLSTVALLLVGVAFLIMLITSINAFSILFIQLLTMTGLISIHLFYWLSLADRQNKLAAPFPLIIGISIELICMGLVFTILDALIESYEIDNFLIGYTGITLVLLAFFVVSYNLHLLHRPIFQKENRLSGQAQNGNNTLANLAAGKDSNQGYFQGLHQPEVEFLLKSHFNLTGRESEIAFLLLSGYQYHQICAMINISRNTVKFHIKNIYAKLGASNRGEALRVVLQAMRESN